ncbi:MAG: dTDP-4-dehydrorhamnose reductase [Desulfobacteraceae bacterium]|nr:dTDP-4-dehydrorhamnose reductase [Desulfobacteraceae bacterium]
MKTLIIGANGQLGWELIRTCPADISIFLSDYPEIDICDCSTIKEWINKTAPDCIINAAAYTDVDGAEQEKTKAYNINHKGAQNLAIEAKQANIHLVHISTDFVFNGTQSKPYSPDDKPDPESVYGKSKLQGELAVKETLKHKALIIRTAWLYSSHGNNFVKTMLNLMKGHSSINVIDEQTGTPTWANSLANAVWTAVEKKLTGTFHYTDAGVASWYDFAVAIQEEGLALGLLSNANPIFPVPTSKFPTPAKRPMYSVLDKQSMWQATGITPEHWRVQLRSMLKELL